ncbi:putative receptor-like protein kinase At1g49730 [Wolffia australiana]
MRGSFVELLVIVAIFVVGSHCSLSAASDCPLDLGWSNFSIAASFCSNDNQRANCCRQINAFVAVAVARYATSTGKLGIPTAFSEICLQSISETLKFYGIPPSATVFCGLGTKLLVNYPCEGRETVMEMLQSQKFDEVSENCKPPLTMEASCRRCVNSGILYLRRLSGVRDNVTLSMCRNAAYVALVNQEDGASIIDIASCFFSVQGFVLPLGPSNQSSSPLSTPPALESFHPNSVSLGYKDHGLKLIPMICLGITATAMLLLVFMILLIRRKSRELEDGKDPGDVSSWHGLPTLSVRKFPEGPAPIFHRFSYKEIKKATKNFTNEIGRGGFGTVYKAEFSNGLVVAVKKIHKFLEQGERDFSREVELLGRLHHRHLVSLRGFCTTRHERFFIYEYMEKGSLKDHLLSTSGRTLTWRRRIQIALDVANALEYLHFYCDPPLCHGDIKPSNILLDANFRAKVADFGLATVSRGGGEQVHTDVHGTPGYVDPEYVLTRELTEKCDVYSYGVLLLELVSGRRAIDYDQNLVEWFRRRWVANTAPLDLVNITTVDSFEMEELRTVIPVAERCTRGEAKARPSMRQVLVALHEGLDLVQRDFAAAVDDGAAALAARRRSDVTPPALLSSSSTSRSCCSRSFLHESGSPQSL